MIFLPVLILSAALFFAGVANLTLKPSFSAKLTTWCLVVSVAGGLLVYGTGFAETTGSILESAIRTPLCVTRMFLGINELGSIAGTFFVRSKAGLVFFWAIHLLAFYSMASAAMVTIGAEALRHLRYLLSRRGDLTLIYGVNENSVALGKECLAAGGTAVVFIAESISEAVVKDLNSLGMSVMPGNAAIHSDPGFIRRLHIGRRKLTVYAMDETEDQNLYYALELKDALEKAGLSPENTRISLPGAEDIITSMLQVSEEAYGFGYVNVYDTANLAARAMIRTCPPWDFISFDENGRATEDFDCVVIGFGSYGQAALRHLVMNGQFAGSEFHAAVFSLDVENSAGYLLTDSPGLFQNYDIRFYIADGRSRELFDYVGSHLKTLKMIAICTGNEELDREISNALMLFLLRRQAEQICVVQCTRHGARYQETVGSPIISSGINTLSMLSAEEADREAIVLNSIYDSSDRTPWEKWVACDTFGKISSRASADFAPAFLKAAGTDRERVLSEGWVLSEPMKQALGETEHRRWNAFHFCVGYTAMTREEFDANVEKLRRCREAGEPCSDRVSRNRLGRTHACLIPWEELDELSERETAATGRSVNYRQLDINNVLALPLLLGAGKDGAAS